MDYNEIIKKIQNGEIKVDRHYIKTKGSHPVKRASYLITNQHTKEIKK